MNAHLRRLLFVGISWCFRRLFAELIPAHTPLKAADDRAAAAGAAACEAEAARAELAGLAEQQAKQQRAELTVLREAQAAEVGHCPCAHSPGTRSQLLLGHQVAEAKADAAERERDNDELVAELQVGSGLQL